MSDILDINKYYDGQCLNPTWYNNYYQCGEVGDGSVFKCFSTNYRNLSSFEYYFEAFKKYIKVPRGSWDKKDTTGQEVAKQYVVNLVESFLYYSSRNQYGELVYDMTSRGKDFQKMLDADFSFNEKKLLVFLFLVNSSFKKTPRYILKRAQTVWDIWLKNGLKVDYLKQSIITFVKEQVDNKKVEEIFSYDILWLLSFYTDSDFIGLYKIANQSEKEVLFDKAVNAYRAKNTKNVLAWKFKNTNLQKPALIDTLVMLYVSNSIFEMVSLRTDYMTFYENIVNDFSLMLPVDKSKVIDFIKNNESVFSIIYQNAISEEDDFTEYYILPYRQQESIAVVPTEKIDTTSQEGVEKLEVVRQVLKKLAKEKSEYRCALEDFNNCTYFTSKEDNHNYLEIHHLIPREFSYDFEDTIEFVENYVPLCPNCHRMIHKAVDRERTGIITYLFNQRIKELQAHNINVDIKTLYKYYKIER